VRAASIASPAEVPNAEYATLRSGEHEVIGGARSDVDRQLVHHEAGHGHVTALVAFRGDAVAALVERAGDVPSVA
jgi:hypothetical protein